MIKSILLFGIFTLAGYKLYQFTTETKTVKPKEQQKTKNIQVSVQDNLLSFTNSDGFTFQYRLTEQFSINLLSNGADWHKKWVADGFIAGIPLNEARKLLSQYPDMNKCGADGSQKARDASRIFDIALQSNNPSLSSNFDQFIKMRRNSRYLTCVRIDGQKTIWHKGQYKNTSHHVHEPNNQAQMVYVTSITPIDCNTDYAKN